MTEELLIEIMLLTFQTIALLATPLIGTVMVVGIVSQVLQTVTQLKDMALAFVPKVVIAGIIFIFCIPWYFELIRRYTDIIFTLMTRATE